MGIMSRAVDISKLGQRKLWVLYGKSSTGKTKVGSSFPKPMLYLQIGDDGSNTIASKKGIKGVSIKNLDELKLVGKELLSDEKYATVFVDTFSMITNIWIDENAVQKKKKMTQNMWGDLKTETEELIRIFHQVAEDHIVLLSCHEATDIIEGMENEILPDVRPSCTKGARTYLEGMANYGIHTTKVSKTVSKDGVEHEVIRYAAHIGANPYYWTKFQVDSSVKLPKLMINPTYKKIMQIIQGGNE